jgi:hypothetical protein
VSGAGPHRQVVFVHLPKTGGMSLHAAMVGLLGEARVLRVGDEAALAGFLAMDRAALARYAFVSGHFTLAQAAERSLPGARFITVLRDPVDRLLSAFNYMASWEAHPRHAMFRTKGFADFVADSGEGLASEACWQLTGVGGAGAAIALLESCYAAVATRERLADLAALVAGWLGLPRPVLARENATPGQGRVTLDSRTCERLLAVTRDDRALFEHVAVGHGGLMAAPGLATGSRRGA